MTAARAMLKLSKSFDQTRRERGLLPDVIPRNVKPRKPEKPEAMEVDTGLVILYDFLVTVKAALHECVIRTGQPQTSVKAEKEAWFYSKVTVSSCAITSV